MVNFRPFRSARRPSGRRQTAAVARKGADAGLPSPTSSILGGSDEIRLTMAHAPVADQPHAKRAPEAHELVAVVSAWAVFFIDGAVAHTQIAHHRVHPVSGDLVCWPAAHRNLLATCTRHLDGTVFFFF